MLQRYEKYSKQPNIFQTFFYENAKNWHGFHGFHEYNLHPCSSQSVPSKPYDLSLHRVGGLARSGGGSWLIGWGVLARRVGGLWRQHIFDGKFGRLNVYYYLCTVKDKLPIMWGEFFPNIENR